MLVTHVFKALRRSRRLVGDIQPFCTSKPTDCDVKSSKVTNFLEWMGWKQPEVSLSTARLIFFYGPKYNDNIGCHIEDYENVFSNRLFFNKKKSVLYIHGYTETPAFESVQVMVDVYAKRSDVNFVLLDWSALSCGSYLFDALPNTLRCGRFLAGILLDVFHRFVDIRTFHIIGHSLGAHLAGIVGREVNRQSKGAQRIRRISGLDPAFPVFYFKPLNKTDALFVDIIHTDAWIHGYPFSTGHADFWPNGGKIAQPGVPKRSILNYWTEEDFASHQRSWWYWAESMSHEYPDNFEAVKAKSWSHFKAGKLAVDCTTRKNILMGANCPFGISGDFFLQTNGTAPFARGKAGTVFVEPKKLPASHCS